MHLTLHHTLLRGFAACLNTAFRKKLLLLLPLLLRCWTLLNAQCTGSQTIHANNVGSSQFGQYIQANCTGLLTNFTYETVDNAGASATVTVRSGIGCSGTILGTQTIAQVIGVNSVNFSPSIAVTNGQSYSIVIVASSGTGIKTNQSGTYSTGGLLWEPSCNVFGASGDWDMVFSYTISPPIPCTTPTAYSVSGSGIICPSASIGLSGSQSGHTYQLQRNGANTGSPVNGTGSALTFPATQTGTYTVVATSPAGGTCTALMSGSAVLTNAWVQTGLDINGEAANDQSGHSVRLSSDGSTLAIGAIGNNNNKGHVRVYKWVSGAWTQQGNDIDGEAANDQSGWSVSLSSDGSIVAIGAIGNNNSKGHVRVYKWVSGAWIQQGNDIDGEATNDQSGFSVSLSSDGSVVAIGARQNNGNGYISGHVRVYKWVSSAWIQQGNDIDGEVGNDLSGFSVSLSSDGSTVAIGAPYNGSFSGHVRVYKWVSGAWTKQGNDIDGEAAYDVSGWSVSLSSDGSVVAIGARQNNDNGYLSGHARVYKWVSGAWTKQGDDINGEAAEDYSGQSVSLSSDGSIVAIGAESNDGNGTSSGHVRVYKWVSGAWIQQGADIDGEAANDQSGISVSLSSDGSTVAIGARYNADNGFNSGHVRVYTLIPCTTPTAYSVSGPGIICPSASASIGLSGSQSGHTYQLQRNGANTGSPVNGTGSALTFQVTQTGTYTVVATSPAGCTCTALMSGSAVLTNDNAPPTITCADPVTVNTTAGQCTGTTTLTAPTASDNCPATGNALHFDGTNDVVRVADNDLLDLNFPLTIETWFYQTSVGLFSMMVDKRTANDNNLGYGIWLNLGQPAFYLDNNGNAPGGHVTHVSPNAVSANAWHHMAAVYDGARVKIYVDGVLTYDQPETSPITPTSEHLSIGDRNQGGQGFAGRLEEVRIWNVARTLSEIQTNMNVELNAQSGLVAVYHFNEGAAGNSNAGVTTAPDPSGNNLNGTLNNFLLSGPTSNWTTGYLNSTPQLTNDAPATYQKGSTVVTWTATDFNGNNNTCQQTVTVVDNQKPTFTCPSNTTVNTNGSANCAVLTPDLLTGITNEADNCGTANLSQDPAVDAPVTGIADGGTFDVTITANDGNGNSNAVPCVVTVTVNDDDKPTFTCPSNTTVNTDGSANCAVLTPDLLTGITNEADNCGTANLSQNPAVDAPQTGIADGGTFTVTVTADDGNGNSNAAPCVVTVTVNDDDKPTITCPANQAVPTAPDNCSTPPVTYAVTSTDNCSSTVSLVSGPPSGSVFPLGLNTVVWKATDPGGNSTTCAFTVTVGDEQNPSIVCPPSISKNTDPNLCTAIATYSTPTVSDNCTGWTLTRTGGLASGSVFPKGVNMVQWQVSDVGGNLAICQFTVTVSDAQKPNITCPSNLVRSNDAGQCYAVVNYATPTASDNCAGVTLMRTSAANTASGSQFPKGTTPVTWEASDAASPANTKSCSFTVTVNDTQLPTIACPANQTKAADAGLCTAVTNYTTPTFTDNCAGGSVAIQSGLASGSAFPKGSTTVVWRATDGAGLTKTCSFRITVNDTQAPTVACPSSQSLNTDAGLCSAVVSYATPTASDNCTPLPTVVKTSGLASGSAFPKGASTVVFKATDGVGLTKTCSFTVTVTDVQVPTATCPGNISVTAAPGQCTTTVTYATPTATDNCAVQSVFLLSGGISGSQFPAGTNTVVWRAVDNSGTSSTCAFTVTVACGTYGLSQPPQRGGATTALSTSRSDVASPPLRGGREGLDLHLSPNPATTEVQIWVENLGKNGGVLSVFDAMGRVVWQQQLDPEYSGQPKNSATQQLSVADFPAGVYFVTLRSEGSTVTKRLVVQRL